MGPPRLIQSLCLLSHSKQRVYSAYPELWDVRVRCPQNNNSTMGVKSSSYVKDVGDALDNIDIPEQQQSKCMLYNGHLF